MPVKNNLSACAIQAKNKVFVVGTTDGKCYKGSYS